MRQLNQKNRNILYFVAVLAICLGQPVFAQSKRPANSKTSQSEGESSVARGKYIVEGVAMCGLCHTRHDAAEGSGQSQWLQGAPVWLKPAQPMQDWPLQAPRLAGTPPGTDEEMVMLLTTGIWQDGQRLRLPMPQFRMNRKDAESVVAYLKSLNSDQH